MDTATADCDNLSISTVKFQKSFKCIKYMYASLNQNQETKVVVPRDWGSKIKNVVQWSEIKGQPMELLNMIWSLVTSEKSPLKELQKRSCIKALIPTRRLNEDFVREVVLWLLNKSSCESTAIVNDIVMLLHGCVVYGVIERSIVTNPVTFQQLLLLLRRRNDIIPWLTVLIRNIASPDLVMRHHITSLLELIEVDVNSQHFELVADLVHYLNYLRPDLFPDNPRYLVLKIKRSDVKTPKMTQELRAALYQAKKRIKRDNGNLVEKMCDSHEEMSDPIDIDEIQVLDKMFFEEFAPRTNVDVCVESLPLLNRMECMIVMLRKRETIPLLACDPETLEYFNDWLVMVFYHRFNYYNPELHDKYLFVLDRCICVATLMGTNLSAVEDWLTKFLPFWDGALFNFEVFELLRFVPLHDFSELFRNYLLKMKSDFVKGTIATRLEIWDCLEAIILRWPSLLDDLRSNDQGSILHLDKINKGAENFFKFVQSLIAKYASERGHKDSLVLAAMCHTFNQMLLKYRDNSIPVRPGVPADLARMVILCDQIDALETCSAVYTTLLSAEKASRQSRESHSFKKEMFKFYARSDDNNAPLVSLFQAEYDAVKSKEDALDSVEAGVHDVADLMEHLNCFCSIAFKKYCNNPNQNFPINFSVEHFRWKDLKVDSPQVYKHLARHKK